MYPDGRPPPYTIEVFEDVGRATCYALLDFIQANPVSRIPLSPFKTLDGLRNELCIQYNINVAKAKKAKAAALAASAENKR